MESGDRGTPSLGLRLAAGCALLTAVAFIQSPGRTVTDTKLDLVVDPGRFLTRATEMWDQVGYLGQVQNQAYGYLFPMGPFFWLGQVASLPPWVIQRLWWALLLSLAFAGFVLLARALRIGGPRAALVGGLFYALSPRILSVIGPSSIEVWPMALAPWVLLPLVVGMTRGSPRRAAALSALAVACVGGVNAVATFAVVPLAGLWLLMNKGPRRGVMLRWWPPLVLLGTAWWIGPLLLLGRYSPPFLDFIESASVTTRLATIDGALRGVTNWVPVVSQSARAGAMYFTEPVVIFNAALVVVVGLVGLTLHGLPHRRFLIVGLMLGVLLVTLGHTGTIEGFGAEHVQRLLDGALAPMRNTHKFDVIVRIPLTLGFVHALAVAARHLKAVPQQWGLGLALGSVLVGAAMPAWSDRLTPAGTFDGIPQYWQDASAWISDHAGPGDAALLLPSSAFPDYLWGSTGDEPVQPLSTGSWILRNSIPLTPPGTIRMLDAVTDDVSAGTADPALAGNLARSGIGYVLVRNDLQVSVSLDRNAVVRESLRRSPGIELIASFGPRVGGSGFAIVDGVRSYSRGGWSSEAPAVEIYRVNRSLSSAGRLPTVAGSAADLLTLRKLGVLSGDAILAPDQTEAPGRYILTDGNREQEVAFGSVDRVRSATRSPGEQWSLSRPFHDYLTRDQLPWLTRSSLDGAVSLRASSMQSSAITVQGRRTDASAWAAFDGSDETAWRADGRRGWLEVDFGDSRELGTVTVRGGLPDGQVQSGELRVGDERTSFTLSGNDPLTLTVGAADRVRIAVDRAAGDAQVASVRFERTDIVRSLDLPQSSWGDPDDIVLGVGAVRRPGCVEFEENLRCRSDVEDLSEDAGGIVRDFVTTDAQQWRVRATMRAVASPGLDELVQRGRGVSVGTSSTVSSDPGSSTAQMLDGSATTAWIADPQDNAPTIRVRWQRPVEVSRLRLTTASSHAASSVARVIVESGATRVSAPVRRGRVVLDAPITTDDLSVRLISAEDARDYRADGTWGFLPPGLSEFSIGSDVPRLDPAEPISLTCDDPSALKVDGTAVAMEGSTTVGDLLRGREATLTACDTVSTPAGAHRVDFAPTDVLVPGSLWMARTDRADASAGRIVETLRWNTNPAWVDDAGAESVVVNGWQQGFATASASPRFEASSSFTTALRLGALAAALLLVGVVTLRGRRDLTAARTWAPRRLVGLVVVVLIAAFAGPYATLAAVAGFAAAAVPRRGAPAVVAAIAMGVSVAVTIVSGEVVTPPATQLSAAVALGAVARAAFTRR